MKIYKSAAEIHNDLKELKLIGKKTGFVPTMGALHQGHISLIEASIKQTGFTVSSIFVNPTQFNNSEDFRLYPSQLEQDIAMLIEAGCDAVFVPSFDEIYPAGISQLPHYELGYLETIMEGKFRPGHFQGVCQVVDRLLEIVNPDLLFLGRKDLQQCRVIEKLLVLTGRHQTNLQICSTFREQDGLAMSSRNQRLSNEQRKKSVVLYQALSLLKNSFNTRSFTDAKNAAVQIIESSGMKLEYLEIVNDATLDLLNDWPGDDSRISVTACIAAFMGEIRLIDNMILHAIE